MSYVVAAYSLTATERAERQKLEDDRKLAQQAVDNFDTKLQQKIQRENELRTFGYRHELKYTNQYRGAVIEQSLEN